MRFENCIGFIDRYREFLWQPLTARQPGDMMLAPAENPREEGPWIGERSRLAFRGEASSDSLAVCAGLLLGQEAVAVKIAGLRTRPTGWT